MATAKQRYVRKLNEIANRYQSLEDDVIKRSISLLEDLKREVAGEVVVGSDWDMFRIRSFEDNLDRLIAQYQAQLSGDMANAFRGAISVGGEIVFEPLRAAGIETGFFQPTPAQVNAAVDYSADLVKKITSDVRAAISTRVKRAVLGGQSPTDAMRDITQALGKRAKTSFKGGAKIDGIAARAETVVRTEMQRVFNMSAHSQQIKTAQNVPDLKKAWTAAASRRTRNSHLEAHVRYRSNPIPIDQPFVLRDSQGSAELMYPLDPSAPARFTINCRCRMVTIHPQLGMIGSPLDASIAKEVKRRGL